MVCAAITAEEDLGNGKQEMILGESTEDGTRVVVI